MSTIKISQLPSITGANTAGTDLIPLVDVSLNVTNKITRSEFFLNVPATTITGDLTIADKIVHAGDTNTAIRFPSNDTVTVETNGAERLRIDASGNVGIGTSSPATRLEVSSGTYRDQLTVHRAVGGNSTAMASILLAGNNSSAAKANYAAIEALSVSATAGAETGSLAFNTATAGSLTEKMRIDSSGNLGLGVTPSAWGSPFRALEFAAASLASTTANPGTLYLMANSFLNASSQHTYKSNGAATLYGQTGGTHQWYTAPSGTAGNTITFTQAMTLDASGNLGIGTASPSSYNGTASTKVLAVGTTSGNNGVNVISGTTSTGSYLFSDSGGNDRGGLIYYHTADTMTMLTAGTERMRIDSSGNVGIGTSSPASELHISAATDPKIILQRNDSPTPNGWITSANNAGSFGSAIQLYGNETRFYTTESTGLAMTLDANGDLGIGTSSPSFKLDIQAVTDPTVRIYSTGTGVSDDSLLRLQIAGTTASNYIQFGDSADSDAGYIKYDHTSDSLAVGVNAAERMRIDSSGNVGIASNAPVSLGIGITTLELKGNSASQTDRAGGISFMRYDGNPGMYIYHADDASYISSRSTYPLLLETNGTERARIDASGNLGLGVTPSAWEAQFRALEVRGAGAYIASNGSNRIQMGANNYTDTAGVSRYVVSNAATAYIQVTGNHQWLVAPSGTAGNPITFTQAMTLDASGNLGILTSSPSARLHVAGGDGNHIRYSGATNSVAMGMSGANPFIGSITSAPLLFLTGGSERARIDASGNLLVGKTAANTVTTADGFELLGSSAAAFCTVNTSGAANTWHLYNRNATNNGYRFYVKVDGGVVNFSANNVNLSDERVKTDIAPVGSYWDKIKAIQVVTYKYKDQSHDDDNIGVIAQQVESVAPEFVSNDGFGETPEDGVPLKSIYEADLHYATLKALQEAMARIEVLEARIAALET